MNASRRPPLPGDLRVRHPPRRPESQTHQPYQQPLLLCVIIGPASLHAAWASMASVSHQVGWVLKRRCPLRVRTGRSTGACWMSALAKLGRSANRCASLETEPQLIAPAHQHRTLQVSDRFRRPLEQQVRADLSHELRPLDPTMFHNHVSKGSQRAGCPRFAIDRRSCYRPDRRFCTCRREWTR